MNRPDNEEYRVIDEQDVLLSLNIGDGQLGTHLIELDFDPVPGGRDGKFSDPQVDLKIDKGSEIKSQTLSITSIISKTNRNSNNASITYTLKGVLNFKPITEPLRFNGENRLRFTKKFKFI